MAMFGAWGVLSWASDALDSVVGRKALSTAWDTGGATAITSPRQEHKFAALGPLVGGEELHNHHGHATSAVFAPPVGFDIGWMAIRMMVFNL
jgi:hypothetical protein